MDEHRLSIPVCHSPGGREGRTSPRVREQSFSIPARTAMERADYWDDFGVKVGMECAFGLPDPEGEWEEVLEEEKPEEWSSVCLHFTQNTTFHGINKITESTPFGIRRVIWVLIVLGGLSLFLSQMVRSVLLYLEYPVTVNTRIIYNKTVAFPAVTICNQNVFRISRAASSGHYFLIDDIYSSSLQQVNLSEYNASHTLQKTLLDDTAHDKNDMIAFCQWDGMPCSADDFVTSITDHGVCFTFNTRYNASVKMASRTGSEGGLRLKLNIEQYEYMQGPNSAAGVKILVHDPTEVPFVRDFGQAISPGSHAFVGLQMTQINNLMKPHGECQAEMSLEFFADYNIPNCQVDCMANYLRSKCNCRMVHMPEQRKYPGDPPYCTLGRMKDCVLPALDQFEVAQRGPAKCDCPVPCTRRKYDTIISYGTMSNFDTEKQGRTMDRDNIRQSFVSARETTQRVDTFIIALDYAMVLDLERAASSIGIIFDQISDKMDNISMFVDDVFYELSNRTHFHQKYGLEVARKALIYGFIQAWDIDQQHVFVPLLSGAKQLLIRYRKAMLTLVNTTSGSPRVFREMVAWSQEEQLSTRLDMAIRARDNLQMTYNRILGGVPLLDYDWAIHSRYNVATVPRCLLRHNVPYLTVLYDYLVSQVNYTIDITRELRHMVRRAFHREEWNVTDFHEIRKAYLDVVKGLTYGHNTFKTAVFGNMELRIDKKIAEFVKLQENMIKERKDVGITIQNFQQLVKTMKDDVWPAIMATVKLSRRYNQDILLNKTTLAARVTSPEIDARLKQMADIFIDVRARARNLDHDWHKFQDAYMSVLTSIKRENTTRRFYEKLNEDFSNISRKPNSSLSKSLLPTFQAKLAGNDPQTLFRWTNADLAEKDEEKHLELARKKFETFITNLSVLSGVNEKDDRFFDVFNTWKESLKKFVADSQINDKFFKENFLKIDVYMTELYYQLVEQREAYDLTSLWSDIGGSMGLFVGASVITVFELIDAMLHNFLKVQLQETKQRRRSMAVARSRSMREERQGSANSNKTKENSHTNHTNHVNKRQPV